MDTFVRYWNRVIKEKGVAATVLVALALLVLLQFWRPLFFLTDDSFNLAFPVWVSIGQRILSGENPFISPYLFGGNYPLYLDSQMIPLWHPAILSLSLLANTGLRNYIVDIYACANVLLAAAGFRWLLTHLKNAGLSHLSSPYAVFVSISYSFSMYALLLGSSGVWYLANLAALPWLVGALWETRNKIFWLIVVAASFHNAVGGYPSCFIYSMPLVGAILIWKTFKEKNLKLFFSYSSAVLLAGFLSCPFILPAFLNLTESTRAQPIPIVIASEFQMPFSVILSSLLVGSGSILFGVFELFGKQIHAYGLVSFLACWLSLIAFIRKKENWGKWDLFLLSFLAIYMTLVARPEWLGNLIYHIPIFSSFRWPHKEIFIIVFILHLWAARGTDLKDSARNLLVFAGALIFLASLTLGGSPSLNEETEGKKLLLNGQADQYWKNLSKQLPEGYQIVPIISDTYFEKNTTASRPPLILTGAANFPAMFKVKSWSGYSLTMPNEFFLRSPMQGNAVGIYRQSDIKELAKIDKPFFLELGLYDPFYIKGFKEGGEKIMLYDQATLLNKK